MFGWYAHSIDGGKRNQDRYAVLDCGNAILAVLADGAGGTGGGESAASLAIDFCLEAARKRPIDSGLACERPVYQADHEVLANADGGETTLVVVVATTAVVFGASVGDSIAWLVEESGRVVDLTERQKRRPFLGSGEARPVAFGPTPLTGGLVLVSDGVHKYVPQKEVAIAVARMPPEQSVRAVLARLLELHRSPPDDATILVCKFMASSLSKSGTGVK